LIAKQKALLFLDSDSDTSMGLRHEAEAYEESDYTKQLKKIREMFPEYRLTSNNELKLILQIYEENINSPIQATSPPFYVSGAMMMLVFLILINCRELPDPKISALGEPIPKNEDLLKIESNVLSH